MLKKIFIVGDSVSIHYGPHLEAALGGFAELTRKSGLNEALANIDKAAGSNNGDSSACLRFLDALFASGQFSTDLLLLNCGLHDIKCMPNGHDRQVPENKYRANLMAICELLKKHRQPLIWIRTTPVCQKQHQTDGGIWRWDADVDCYNAIADAVMAANGIPSIDLNRFSLSLGPVEKTLTDGRHFSENARERQGAFIGGWLRGWFAAA